MKRRLITILVAAAVVAPLLSPLSSSPASAQEVSRLNQDMDDRPNLQAEQTVGGHTSAPGVKVQTSPPASKSRPRRRAWTSKTPHFRVAPPARSVKAH